MRELTADQAGIVFVQNAGSMFSSYIAEIRQLLCAKELAENFILHRRVGLAPNVVPELRLDHAEHRFDIRAPSAFAPSPPGVRRGAAAVPIETHRYPRRPSNRSCEEVPQWCRLKLI